MRAGAQGLLGAQAAVELLIGHEGWLRRDDFVAQFVTMQTRPTPAAWVDWHEAIVALDAGGLPCSGGQAGVLRIAASIAEGVPVDLGQALIGLDQHSPDRPDGATPRRSASDGRLDRAGVVMTTVTIMRPRHPLQGQPLRVLGQMRRHGRLELLAVLPDGSKTLIPAAWTDLADNDNPAAHGQAEQATSATLGTLADLGRAVGLVRALSTRTGETQEQAARPSPSKEDHRAAYTAESDTRLDTDATPNHARPTARPADDGGDQPAGRLDRQSRHTDADGGRP